MKIYIAAPLFCEGERAFNEKVDAVVRECGHETFLPQKAGGCVADLPEIIGGLPKRKYLFQLDCAHMDWCDAILSCWTAGCRTRAAASNWDTATRRGSAASATKRTPAPSSTALRT